MILVTHPYGRKLATAWQPRMPVLHAGIAYYECVRIHPFVDGSGRTARALATLILYKRCFDTRRFFALEE